jgi:hypothetical protein
MAAAEGQEGYGELQINRLFCKPVCNRTRRDSTRRGRQSRRSETGSVLSAEVTAPARDDARRQRRASYGS